MRRFFALWVACMCLLQGAHAQFQLSPKVEADRQMMAASQAMRDGDWKEAVRAFEAVEVTGFSPLPEVFGYSYGNALGEAGEQERAKERLLNYLNTYGEKGKYYVQAMEQLNAVEKRQRGAAQEIQRQVAAQELLRQEKEVAERQWTKVYFRHWILDVAGRGSCQKTQRKLDEYMQRSTYRNFSCNCNTASVNHPAWRGHSEDICRGELEFNAQLDVNARVSGKEGETNRWGFEIKKGSAFSY